MDRKYNEFHKQPRIQNKVIADNNFTYYNIIKFLYTNKLISHNNEINILDYGCGVGTLSMFLSFKKNKVLGVDISPNAIDVAKKSAKKTNLSNIQFQNLQSFINKKEKSKYDLVICSEVIEHVQDDDILIKRLSTLTKKNGYVLVTTPSKFAPLYKLGLLADFDKSVGHLRRYDIKTLKSFFDNEKMTIIKVETKEGLLRNLLYCYPFVGVVVKFIKGPISDLVMFVDNIFVKLFGGSNIFILAQKK